MRNLLAVGLILTSLTLPVLAQDSGSANPSPPPNQAQLQQQRDRLRRYGARLAIVEQQYHVFQRVCDVATDDQRGVLQKLRISPSQAVKLVKLVQENMPDGAMDSESFKALRRKITPKAEDILGSEQFDMLLELLPSPQQNTRIQAILNDAANTPEGKLAVDAGNELSACLTPEQRRFIDPFLLRIDSTVKAGPVSKPAAKAKPAPKPKTAAPPERHLVLLFRNSLGDIYAETTPIFDYVVKLPHNYRVEGGDASVLAALSNAGGLPVRVLGNFKDDVVQVAGTNLSGPPSLVDAAGYSSVWHGHLPAKVVSTSPPTVQLDAGRGEKITAVLDFQNSGEQQKFDEFAKKGVDFLLGGTCLVKPDKNTLVDLDFAPYQPPSPATPSSLLVQLSEQFLRHTATEYVAGHPDLFSGGTTVSYRVSDLGATLLGCQPGQLRMYGRVCVSHTGLDLVEGELEMLATPTFVKSRLQLTPVPGSLQLRLDFPLYAATPKSWSDNLERIMGTEYLQGVSLPVPEQYRDQILNTGLVQASQLDQLQIFTLPSGDRRTALVTVAAPGAGAADVLRSRIQSPGEFSLALSDEAIDSAIKKAVPPMLPILRPVPEDQQMQDGVKLSQIEIPELDLSFREGLVRINNCVINVHWSYGPFSGVEPGVRFKGTAQLNGQGDPVKLTASLHVDTLEFLSSRVTSQSPEDQQKLKDRLLKAMQEKPLELPTPADIAITVLGPRAGCGLTGVSSSPSPSELLIQGRIKQMDTLTQPLTRNIVSP